MADNSVVIKFEARSINEGFARLAVAAFMMEMNPTMDELQDVKTAVSEAVTNAIVHGYGEDFEAKKEVVPEVEMRCQRYGRKIVITISDTGTGIENVEEARQPFFTTKADMDRSGMGFSFMETFMDSVEVLSEIGKGTTVILSKCIGEQEEFTLCEQGGGEQ